MEQKITPPWTKGLIISLILIVYGLALYFSGQMMNRPLGMVSFLIFIVAIIIADVNFAKQKNGNVTFGNVFAHGFKVTAGVIVISCIYAFVAFTFIYPEMIDKMQEMARADMEKRGGASEEQITQGLQMWRKFFWVFMIGGIMVMYGICGVIASLIGAGVAKKNPNYNPLEQAS
ncbi:MAG: hypothetical protein JWQ30_1631 [Sediminibacterium sp.]|nr:hypothetical protein [Sediminibacterium sp.]